MTDPRHWMNRATSRKLWAWIAMTTLATVMRYDNAITSEDWRHVVMWVTMAYVGFQAVQDISTLRNGSGSIPHEGKVS